MNRAFFATCFAKGARQLSAPCDTRDLAIAYAGAEEWDISQTAIIGPVPIDYLEREDTMERTWAIFETSQENLDWIMGDNPEGFDCQAREPGKFIWLGNVVAGTTPASAYKEYIDSCGDRREENGLKFFAVPLGLFGPLDWMARAGKMLSKLA